MANERERMVNEILENPFDYFVRINSDQIKDRIYTLEELEEFERRPDGIQG